MGIQDECNEYLTQAKKELKAGEVYTSSAGKLNCKKIIHAVGPRWKGGSSDEENSLLAAVDGCFREAEKHKLQSIALPPLSTGIFGYPLGSAVSTIVKALQQRESSGAFLPNLVIFTDNKDNSLRLFEQELRQRYDQTSSKSSMPGNAQGGAVIILIFCFDFAQKFFFIGLLFV